MEWPPVGLGPAAVLLYYWLLWLLLAVGPVAAWIAIYYLWLKPRWEPPLEAARKALEQRDLEVSHEH